MKKYRIKYFLIGTNIATESIMPKSWFYTPKYDSLNIKSIYKKFGSGRKLKTFPTLNLFEYIKYHYFKGHNSVALLDYMYYNKPKALTFLEEKLDYKPYPGKHYESKITRFYQAFILPEKYNVDKRKAHLSSLIVSEQISRNMAIKELGKPLFQSELEKENEIEFFCKKLLFSKQEFNNIIEADPVSHDKYYSYKNIFSSISKIIKRKK